MFSAQFIRSSKRDYPRIVTSVEVPWLEMAGEVVKASAKRDAPVDTGNLRGSIDYDVHRLDHETIVGTNVDYAQHVEYGTVRSRPQPFLRPAIDKNRRRLMRELANMIRAAIKRG